MEIYERTLLVITEFDNEDVITTSGGSGEGEGGGAIPLDPYEGGGV